VDLHQVWYNVETRKQSITFMSVYLEKGIEEQTWEIFVLEKLFFGYVLKHILDLTLKRWGCYCIGVWSRISVNSSLLDGLF